LSITIAEKKGENPWSNEQKKECIIQLCRKLEYLEKTIKGLLVNLVIFIETIWGFCLKKTKDGEKFSVSSFLSEMKGVAAFIRPYFIKTVRKEHIKNY
jgi:hypothetical protein